MNCRRRFINTLVLLLALALDIELLSADKTTPSPTSKPSTSTTTRTTTTTTKTTTTTTTTTRNPGYIGCYADSVARRDVYSYQGQWAKMTIEACITTCATAGYSRAGLQAGTTCFCGNFYGRYGALDESSCNSTCSGNRNTICGAPLANSVFKTGVKIKRKADPYVGCYQDWVKRDLNGYFYSDSSLTVESCVATCTAANYQYAGMQAGNLCFCGDTYGKWGMKTFDLTCNVPCIGNAYEHCGGNMMSNIYSTGIVKSELNSLFVSLLFAKRKLYN